MAKTPKDFPRNWDHSKGLPPGWAAWEKIAQHYPDQEALEKDYPGITGNGGVYGHVVMTPNGPAVPTPPWMEANQRTVDGLARLKAMGSRAPLHAKELHAQHINAEKMLEIAKSAGKQKQPPVQVQVGMPQIAPRLGVSIGKPVMAPQVSIGRPQIEPQVAGLTIPVRGTPPTAPAGYAPPTVKTDSSVPVPREPELKDFYQLYGNPTE